MNKVAIGVATAFLLSACANPEAIDERKVGDDKLSCSQIKDEIYEAERFKDKASKAKGVTGTNVAAAVFFWPAMIVTYGNANDAIDAAKDRKDYLVRLADKKGCSL